VIQLCPSTLVEYNHGGVRLNLVNFSQPVLVAVVVNGCNTRHKLSSIMMNKSGVFKKTRRRAGCSVKCIMSCPLAPMNAVTTWQAGLAAVRGRAGSQRAAFEED
jgi:hypothetical protein